MDKKEAKKNGFTLIESLLSIILLFIILTFFIGFFTQSAKFTQKNNQKLQTVQTAQKYINLIEAYISLQDLQNNEKTQPVFSTSNATVKLDQPTIVQLIEADMNDTQKQNIQATLDTPYVISGSIANTPMNLIQFQVTVDDPQDSNNTSETYTYIRK